MLSKSPYARMSFLLTCAAMAACGQEQPSQDVEMSAPLKTQEQRLQCQVPSQSLGEGGQSQKLNCGAQTGWSFHSGDANRDGLSDVLIGAPGDISNRGSACLVLGNTNLNFSVIKHKLSGDPSARAGVSVALGNLPGTDDSLELLTGATGANANKGGVYTVDGAVLSTAPQAIPLSNAAKYLGAVANDAAGAALAVGDVTGDGQTDLIVGAPFNESLTAQANSGVIYIVKNTVSAPHGANLSATPVRIQNTAPQLQQSELRAGTSLALADLNGDGNLDLIVGIPGYRDGAKTEAGAAFVFHGPVTGTRALSSADIKFVGASAGDLAGTAIARVGDVDGDGDEEILVGAPSTGATPGKAYLIRGGTYSGTVSLGSIAAFTGAPGDQAGASVAAGDFNADNRLDLLIGAPGHQADKGAVYLVHGKEPAQFNGGDLLGSTVTLLEGESTGDRAGHAVASAGDFNGDEAEDILIGAPGKNGGQGIAYLIRGQKPRAWLADKDGDGFGAGNPVMDCAPPAEGTWVLGGSESPLDCNDSRADVHPGAIELCSTVGVDDNCNGATDEDGASDTINWGRDADGDSYIDPNEPLRRSCASPGPEWVNNEGAAHECNTPGADNDPDPDTYAGAPEKCDGKDNDCNEAVDDGPAAVWYVDVDGDGDGSLEFLPHLAACSASALPGYVDNKDDCNDRDATLNRHTRWYVDADADGVGNATDFVESCTPPAGQYSRRNDDCDDTDSSVSPTRTETCEPEDGPQRDNNCNGTPDDSPAAAIWFSDADGDGHGGTGVLGRFCGKPANSSKVTGDCDDTQPLAFPGNTEVCEINPDPGAPPHSYFPQIDNNCDGDVNDSEGAIWWYGDGDRDGYPWNVFALLRCSNPTDRPGEVRGKYIPKPHSPPGPPPQGPPELSEDEIDCNDTDPSANVLRMWYPDTDGDLCGDPSKGRRSCHNPGACGEGSTPYVLVSRPECI
ncbi:Putative metal-binding motif-containing protein [Stigmatella erecta]|uniref:Putative metal-binding motif-containing protein n=1 Tax=Stigmatella erecta TaxID=83460 RepID=A0A1I0KRF7_9BACT|nr:Putative metal-binding motif-containing protein [Stigmatella erecta]